MAKSAVMSVRITGNSDNAVKAFQKAQAKASAFGSFMGGMAVKGVTALWDTVKGFAHDVMDMSDSTDKFVNTMNFAGLDTKAVDKARKATRAYADATVYDLNTIQNTTAQLAANGVKDYTGLTEAAGNLNAVAGGNADTFKSVAMVLTQTAGAGKLTTENWNQLADAIPGASGQLQKALLKNKAYTGNFRDAMSKGQITADEFNKALKDIGMTDVAKEAATSTSTMEGAFGNLEAAVVGGLTDAFDTFKPAVTRAMSAAADKISSFSARATKALKGVTELVANGNFTTELREAFNIEEDNPIVAWLLDLRDSAISTFDTVKRKAGEFIQAFRDTASIQAAGKALKTVWDAAGKLGRAMGDLIGALFPVNEAMGGASGAGKMFGDAFNTALGVITSLASTMAGFGEWVSANSEPIATALIGIGAGFAVFKVATTIQAVVTALKGLDLANKAAAASQWLLNAAMNANPLILIISLLAAVAAELVYFFTQTDKGRQIWSSFTSFIGTCASNIVNFFKSIPGKIKQFFEDAKTGVTNTWNSVVDWFRGIPDRILGALGNVGNLLKNAGKAIIDGFLGGLKGAWDNVTGWIGGIGSWIADHKGPLSYDRKLLVPAGKAIMNGLAKGLKTGFRNDVENAIDRANKGVDAMRLSMAGRRLATTAGGAAGTQVTNVNVTVEGLVVDREGTARAIQKLLREYAASRA